MMTRDWLALRANEDGELRLVCRERWFERMLSLTYTQIMHYGKGDSTVVETLLTSLAELIEQAPGHQRAEALIDYLEGILCCVDLTH